MWLQGYNNYTRAAVRAIFGAFNLSGNHARYLSKVYKSGIQEMEILHHPANR